MTTGWFIQEAKVIFHGSFRKSVLVFGLIFFIFAGFAPLQAATQAEIDTAIENGIDWLIPLQGSGGVAGAWPGDSYMAANSAFAAAVLEHYAEKIGKSPLDPTYAYSSNIQAALDYIISAATYDSVNGWVYWNERQYVNCYESGPALMAIARCGAPDAVVSSGDLAGFTYKEVAQMAVDWLVSAQITSGDGTGAWYYYKDATTGDQSATGWVTMGLGYAAHSMECTIPADVLTRLDTWNEFIQNHNATSPDFGGAAYMNSYLGWYNVYKTGHLLFAQGLVGKTVADQRVQDALTFMVNHWNDPTNGAGSSNDWGWRGNPPSVLPSYIATMAAMKGFTEMDIETFGDPAINPYNDFAEVIVNNQWEDGHWLGGGHGEMNHRSTCWALLTLLRATSHFPPVATTSAASSVTGSTAVLNGNLTDLGTAESAVVSFQWGTVSGSYTNETTTQTLSTIPSTFNASISGLSQGVTYYFRAKAVGDATGYGDELSFSTPANTPPTVSTSAATSVTYNSAVLNGNLSNLGTATSVDVSFEWGTTSGGPYPNSTTAETMSSTGTFNASLSSLSEDTTYYFRAFADGGSDGTDYGDEQSFTTDDPPTVSTSAATSVTYDSAVLNGNLGDLGTASSVDVSFEWGTTSGGPYPNSTTSESLSSTGTFNASLSSLSEDTTYYFRAVADAGDSGTSYGDEASFPTDDPPTVSTSAATSVTYNSAVLNGNLTDLGTASSVDVSFEWGTTSGGPYPNSTTSESMSSTGTFNASLSSLSEDTTYYFRAVADAGDSGTSYGDEASFPTDDPPTVSTSAATSVTYNSAVLNGNLTELGTASPVDVYFEWGTTSGGPYPSSTTTQSMSSTGTFSAPLTSLSANEPYYFRAVADGGDSGTTYGDEVGFQTETTFVDVETDPVVGEVNSGSAVVSGEVTFDGGLPVTRRGMCWDTSPNPTVSPSVPAEGGVPSIMGESSVEGSGVGSFSSLISPLRAATRYYVRAWAENDLGIIYGNEETFVTPGDAREAMGALVNEPGSQLVYLLDTGINAEELYGTDANYTSNSVRQYGHETPVNQNFISITNTNPEQAVTVHFRYFNSDCVDFFDFLVVLTCNDTMMIDPFNFTVPGTDSVNVKDRFFGYPNKAEGTGQSFDAIPASTFADGRFLLFVTASADVKTGFSSEWNKDQLDPDYDNLDLIPYEFINYREEKLNTHCGAWEDGSGDAADESLYGNYDVYGGTNGFSDDNLHILNASAVSFNYLTGFQTVAKVTELGAQASYMTTAWARPAVFAEGAGGAADMPAPIHALLTGGERIWTEAGANGELVTSVAGDQYILRHEAHAGDQWDRGEDSLGFNWIISEGGALGWEIFPSSAMPAEKQVVNFISFMDNYNGESNLAQGATPSEWDDVSYNIQPVVTIYTVEPFNNSEDPWIPSDPDDQPIVSPVTPEMPLVTAIAVKCINTYEIDPESNLNDAVLGYKFGEFTLQDLYDMNAVIGTDSLTLEGFLNVLAGSQNELANEVGPGWMKLSRWFTTRKWTTVDLYPEYVYSYWQGWDDSGSAPYELTGPTIFTEGQANYVFENFGAGKWLSTVISE